MAHIDLKEEDVQLLRDLVEASLSDLRDEIHSTDNAGYKDMLKQRREALIKLLAVITHGQSLPLVED